MRTYETEVYRDRQMVAAIDDLAGGGFTIAYQTVEWPGERARELVLNDAQPNWFPTLSDARRAAFATIKLKVESRPW